MIPTHLDLRLRLLTAAELNHRIRTFSDGKYSVLRKMRSSRTLSLNMASAMWPTMQRSCSNPHTSKHLAHLQCPRQRYFSSERQVYLPPMLRIGYFEG